MANYREKCIKLLESRGVTISDLCDVAVFLQIEYHPELTSKDMEDIVLRVLDKREVQFAVMTAVELDRLAESHKMEDKDLESLLINDNGLYGVDEVLAYGICNLYGSIALTNFGYVDKKKYGIIDRLNRDGKGTGVCNTFVDDVVGAISASAAAHFAHATKVRRVD